MNLDVSRAELFAERRWQKSFRWLRKNAPVHYCPDSKHVLYWSVSRYQP
jgi:hypothetical protein